METSDIADNSLPALTMFSGEWEPYEEALYSIFIGTILKGNLSFQGLRVGVRRMPEYKGKHFAFWHLISEGKKEEERIPDLRRCERLLWVAWMIKNCDTCPDICWWENTRENRKHIVIWSQKENYAVILGQVTDYFLIRSAYPVAPHRIQSFIRERDAFNKGKKK